MQHRWEFSQLGISCGVLEAVTLRAKIPAIINSENGSRREKIKPTCYHPTIVPVGGGLQCGPPISSRSM
jgi:hypothetical protein